MRSILAAIAENFDGPLATIRECIGPASRAGSPPAPTGPHLATALSMCDDVSQLTRRYLDFIDQVEALPRARATAERPDELLAEIDRRILPEALGRGVAWSCASEGPIRPMETDRALCLEALLEWAMLAVESARPGDCVSLSSSIDPTNRDRIRMTLSSSAGELVADLGNLCEDPLFNRLVCVEEVGSDAGSRLAMAFERLDSVGAAIRFEGSADGPIRAVHFLFPEAAAAATSTHRP